jgi:hypothetical protein
MRCDSDTIAGTLTMCTQNTISEPIGTIPVTWYSRQTFSVTVFLLALVLALIPGPPSPRSQQTTNLLRSEER